MGVRLVRGWIGWGDPHPPGKLTYQVVQVIVAGLPVKLQQAGFQKRPQELVGLFFFRFPHWPGRLAVWPRLSGIVPRLLSRVDVGYILHLYSTDPFLMYFF